MAHGAVGGKLCRMPNEFKFAKASKDRCTFLSLYNHGGQHMYHNASLSVKYLFQIIFSHIVMVADKRLQGFIFVDIVGRDVLQGSRQPAPPRTRFAI